MVAKDVIYMGSDLYPKKLETIINLIWTFLYVFATKLRHAFVNLNWFNTVQIEGELGKCNGVRKLNIYNFDERHQLLRKLFVTFLKNSFCQPIYPSFRLINNTRFPSDYVTKHDSKVSRIYWAMGQIQKADDISLHRLDIFD